MAWRRGALRPVHWAYRRRLVIPHSIIVTPALIPAQAGTYCAPLPPPQPPNGQRGQRQRNGHRDESDDPHHHERALPQHPVHPLNEPLQQLGVRRLGVMRPNAHRRPAYASAKRTGLNRAEYSRSRRTHASSDAPASVPADTSHTPS